MRKGGVMLRGAEREGRMRHSGGGGEGKGASGES
jgi:hypothetical protein